MAKDMAASSLLGGATILTNLEKALVMHKINFLPASHILRGQTWLAWTHWFGSVLCATLDTRCGTFGLAFIIISMVAEFQVGSNVSIHAVPVVTLRGWFLGFVEVIISGEEVSIYFSKDFQYQSS